MKDKHAWLILILLAFVWGSSFELMKKAMYPVEEGKMVMGPFQVGTLRTVIAGIILFPFALKFIRSLSRKNWYWLLLIGGCGNFIPAMLFTLAETKIEGSLAGLLNMGTSFFVVFISLIFYRIKPTLKQITGIILGSFGLFMLLSKRIEIQGNDIYYAGWIILATCCYAISVTTIKYKLKGVKALAITSLSFMSVLPLALGLSIYFNSYEPIFNHTHGLKSLGYLSVLSIVGTAFAVALFTKLVEISSALFASGVTYLIPIVAVIIGIAMGDMFMPNQFIWAIFILTGVYLMNKSQKAVENKN